MPKPLKPSSTNSKESIDLETAVAREKCERDHLFFSRYFFKPREGFKFRVNWHHALIADKVQAVIDGKIKNLVINVPPGSSKTELVSINLMARGLALNPYAKFLHISYSDDLALLNSGTAKEIVQSDEFQALWPLQIANDAKSKKLWNVVVDGRKAGGVYAVSLGGQITGFRAGRMAPGFYGAIIIDDPLKPADADSRTMRRKANRALLNTVKSRKANPETPIIVIMQRLAEDDPTGFIKGGGLPGDWEFISIPALIDDRYIAALDPKYAEMIEPSERDEKGRFSYWPYKEPLAELLEMEKGVGESVDGQKMSRYIFAGQYMQRPSPEGGDIIKGEWFRRYSQPPRFKKRLVYVDTAQKTKEHNDYTVFLLAGLGVDGGLYLLDLMRGKWEAWDLEQRAQDFWSKHLRSGAPPVVQLQAMKVEDKSSGTGLIQNLKNKKRIPVKGIQVDTDKYTRVLGVQGYIESGFVYIPENAPWVADFVTECEAFTPDDTHEHDDQIDPLVMAIMDLLASKPKGFFDV